LTYNFVRTEGEFINLGCDGGFVFIEWPIQCLNVLLQFVYVYQHHADLTETNTFLYYECLMVYTMCQ